MSTYLSYDVTLKPNTISMNLRLHGVFTATLSDFIQWMKVDRDELISRIVTAYNDTRYPTEYWQRVPTEILAMIVADSSTYWTPKPAVIHVLISELYGVDSMHTNTATVAWAAAYIARELGQEMAQIAVDGLNAERRDQGFPIVGCSAPFAATDEGHDAELAARIIAEHNA